MDPETSSGCDGFCSIVHFLFDRLFEMIHRLILLSLLLFLAACAVPQARYIHVSKSKREMVLLDEKQEVIKKYNIALGFDPLGHKTREGDGKTPEGIYTIGYKNPKSRFFKSLHISYPNATDYAVARTLGYKPGGDIVIHGVGNSTRARDYNYRDWTWGCIAVRDHEMAQIYNMVQAGTPILIEP